MKGPTMSQQPQQTTPNYTYVDLPELSETYADSIHDIFFDGQSVKITLTVTRMNPPGQQSSGRRYPACRLVLPLAAAAALSDQLNKLGATIAQRQAETRGGSAVPPKQ